MRTTGRSKRSTSSTDSTELTQEAKYIVGQLLDDEMLIKRIIRMALSDLCAKDELRKSALRYILSDQFKRDCDVTGVPHQEVLFVVNLTTGLKKTQIKSIIRELLRKIRV